MQTIRCSGVPEHFNLPWKLAIEEGLFEAEGIKLIWSENASGTGAMCKELEEGKTDLAITLTEGAISNISKGNSSRICSFFVESPLIWGVHAGADMTLSKNDLAKKAKFAISRFTSGSHLMAFLYLKKFGKLPSKIDFNVINHLKGAIQELRANPDQLFLWEKFTTKPFVTDGSFVRIDEISTPWPAFVVMASNSILKNNQETIKKVLSIVQNTALKLKTHPKKTIELISKRYQLTKEDSAEWFSTLTWAKNTEVDLSIVDFVSINLFHLGLLDNKPPVNELIFEL